MPNPLGTGYFGAGEGSPYLDRLRNWWETQGAPGGAWEKNPLGGAPPIPGGEISYESRRDFEDQEKLRKIVEVAINAGRTSEQGPVDLQPPPRAGKKPETYEEYMQRVLDELGMTPGGDIP